MVECCAMDSPKGMMWYIGRVVQGMVECCVMNSPKVIVWHMG